MSSLFFDPKKNIELLATIGLVFNFEGNLNIFQFLHWFEF